MGQSWAGRGSLVGTYAGDLSLVILMHCQDYFVLGGLG